MTWDWLTGELAAKVGGSAGLVASGLAWLRVRSQKALADVQRAQSLERSLAQRLEHLERVELVRDRQLDELRVALRASEEAQWRMRAEYVRVEAELSRVTARVVELEEALAQRRGGLPALKRP